MGESVDFVKALTEAFKDTTVQDVFKSMFNPVMDDLAKDFENKMNVWHKKFVDDMRSEMDALRSNLKMKDDKIKNLEVEIAALKHDKIGWNNVRAELLCGFRDYPKGTTKMCARRSWTCAIKNCVSLLNPTRSNV